MSNEHLMVLGVIIIYDCIGALACELDVETDGRLRSVFFYHSFCLLVALAFFVERWL